MNTMTKQTKRLVYGVGINDLAEPVKINGKTLKFYAVWKHMIERCYSEKYQARQPTYVGCTVCGAWLSLSTFKEWYNIHYRDGMELDKDILIPGNKVYCPEACSFVPQWINNLLTDAEAIRGDLPCGVSALKPNSRGKVNVTYVARCRDGQGGVLSKTYKMVSEAVTWYSATKKRVVKERATRALESGDITEDVYQALITREW